MREESRQWENLEYERMKKKNKEKKTKNNPSVTLLYYLKDTFFTPITFLGKVFWRKASFMLIALYLFASRVYNWRQSYPRAGRK